MNGLFARGPALTQGERGLMLGYFFTGLFGAALALVIVLRLDAAALFGRALVLHEYWILTSGLLGGALGVRVARGRLARPGPANAVMGMVSATLFGAVIAGTLALPGYGTMFGPLALVLVFFAAPPVAILWAVNLIGVRVLVRAWDAERDSIFAPGSATAVRTRLRTALSRMTIGG